MSRAPRYGLPLGAIHITGQNLRTLIVKKYLEEGYGVSLQECTLVEFVDVLSDGHVFIDGGEQSTQLCAGLDDYEYASVARGGYVSRIIAPYWWPYDRRERGSVIVTVIRADFFGDIFGSNPNWADCIREGRKNKLEHIEQLIFKLNDLQNPIPTIRNAANSPQQSGEVKADENERGELVTRSWADIIVKPDDDDGTDGEEQGLILLRGDQIPLADAKAKPAHTHTPANLGGDKATDSPKGERDSKKPTHIQRLKRLGFEDIKIENGKAKTGIRYFEDAHIDIIEKQFTNFLEVSETRRGNDHFELVTSDALSNKKQGAQVKFRYEGVCYSIGLCRRNRNRNVRIWFKREPGDQKERSKYANFIYIE